MLRTWSETRQVEWQVPSSLSRTEDWCFQDERTHGLLYSTSNFCVHL